jgi:DsbC/DsbD-like thiol-disulfide interchange protein
LIITDETAGLAQEFLLLAERVAAGILWTGRYPSPQEDRFVNTAFRIVAVALSFVILTATASAQAKKTDTVVKTDVKADKIADDGTQVVTVTLTIDKPWHLYANPVGNEDLQANQVAVSVSSKNKLQDVKVEYPEGKVVKDKTIGDYKKYEGTVTIKATVRRTKGDTEPLDVAVKMQACSDNTCLFEATVKRTVK